jgi:hypothetical protein
MIPAFRERVVRNAAIASGVSVHREVEPTLSVSRGASFQVFQSRSVMP